MNGLEQIINDPKRLILENIEEKYLSDSLGRRKGSASALVFPVSTAEVSAVMAYAFAHKIPVTPRGAGTNLVGSTIPREQGIVLDLSLMNRVLEIDGETFTAVVEAGVVLQDFQALVEKQGLFYPPDPGEKTATIGGNIATNAGGMRAVKYGVTRDYVRGLELVLANGDVVKVGGKTVKDASGLALKQLVIGSEGTLAVITKCTLRLIPKPEQSVSLLIPYATLEDGISSVTSVIRSGANPTAIEFIEQEVIELGEQFTGLKFPCHKDAKAYLLVTLDGGKSEVDAAAERLRAAVLCDKALDFTALEPESAGNVWRIRGCLVNAVEDVSEQEPIDIVVPINRTAEFISFVHETEKKTGMRMISFGHAGDGNVHLCVVRGDRGEEQWKHELHENMSIIYGEAYALGGLTSGEHGIGLAKRSYYLESTPEVNLKLMRAIKDAWDEKRILNDHISYLA